MQSIQNVLETVKFPIKQKKIRFSFY